MEKKPYAALIPLFVAALAASAALALFVHPLWVGLLSAAIVAACFLIGVVIVGARWKQLQQECDDIFQENSSAASTIINTIDVPALIFDDSGRIIWSNEAMDELYMGRDITKLVPTLDVKNPAQATTLEYNGKAYQIMCSPIKREHPSARKLSFQYWLDRTEALHYTRLYEENLPVVALIYVDNYEELTADKQFHRNSVLSDVESLVSNFASSIQGTYRRYENARFFLIFEAKYMEALEKDRFKLLELAHNIDTGTEQTITLSIAVGSERQVAQSDESARQAMELALGRGGDQAVVKRGTNYDFYGGQKQMALTKQSRVKARLFAKALRQLMENSDMVFVMGHKNADMDCIGAALGIMRLCQCATRRGYIVIDESNSMIEGALGSMAESKQYHDSVRTPDQALQMIRPTSVLIVVDTQRVGSVLSQQLYQKAAKTVIIDHHRRPVDSLSAPTLNYYEAGASSACEMVTEIMQYFADGLKPTPFESSALLAGMTMDTKSFAINTGARTFEAAGFLRRNGADTSMVKLMYQDDMATFRNRARVVENATIMEGGIAISTCPKDMPNNMLIAAQAADSLLSIKGIQASFVLAETATGINISGRSLGQVNVQLILERIGGGGHLAIAGAQLKDISIDEAVDKLTESIYSYLDEIGTDYNKA
jgi:cyclic-di-AMP phosphodiesterase